MAAYKYDEYQQFSPGMRFVESLARWLYQFATIEERRRAYEFVKTHLVFCSTSELTHLVESAYPDHIRPILLRRLAHELGMNPRHVGAVAGRPEFAIFQRQCLFLGLSDGSRIDVFRRANQELNHEQIWQTYELSESRVQKLLEKVAEHVGTLSHSGPVTCKFRTVVLLDDFSASGSSYFSYKAKTDGSWAGKVAEFVQRLASSSDPVARLVDLKDLEVITLLYVATEQARDYLRERSRKMLDGNGVRSHVEVVQLIPKYVQLTPAKENPVGDLIDKYYDHDVFDTNLAKGGTTDAKYGYAGCGLPVVLHHNTPNNSLALLWSYEGMNVRGLFPRVQRHKEIS
jgi:hypothetical protein